MAYAKSHGLFEFYQPNTHKCGDCVIRALTKALNKSWFQVFDELAAVARSLQRPMGDTESMNKYLGQQGFIWIPIRPKKGEKRPTVSSLAQQLPADIMIVNVASHTVCVRGGKYYDIWDCGSCSVYGFWIKK